MLSRTVLPTTPPSVEYALTDLGKELIPAIRAIVEVGSKLNLRTMTNAASYTASALKQTSDLTVSALEPSVDGEAVHELRRSAADHLDLTNRL